MSLKFLACCCSALFVAGACSAQQKMLTSFVDPFIGTDGFGHTFPGATTPFGMVQLSPDTRTSGWENCSGYHASNPTILGFSHTHLSGTGAADYGDILFTVTEGTQLLPGDEKNPLDGYRSAFEKESERAAPGYYRVMLADHGIQAEMSATTRCGIQKYTIPAMDDANVILDLVHGISDRMTDSRITLAGKSAVAGYRRSTGWAKDHTIYFYTEFSKPFDAAGLADKNGKTVEATDAHACRAWFRYKTRNYESILIRTGISTVSIENAKMNLEKEVSDWDFNRITREAKQAWETELSRIVVEGGSREERTNFYTALYHCMIAPNTESDVDGRYMGMDGTVRKMERGKMYSVFSLWDTFRALHPLFTIIDPIRAQGFVRALLQKYVESGMLPVWELASNETGCMIGYHSVPVIADAILKGLRDFDMDLALEAMKKSATQDVLGISHYKSQGFIPSEKENESVSKTLEYAYDDWCIARVAEVLGKKEDAAYYMRRSQNYRNVYNPATGFMQGKKNSRWVTPFDPFEVSGLYTEANAWQYTWFVPHDVAGLMELMGGKTAFAERLNQLFTVKSEVTGRDQPDISGLIGQYAHGNEPSHHMAYLFDYTENSHRTAELTRQIMTDFYKTTRDGLAGNEDCGQMSAWYVFSALGIYPVCPGDNAYAFGSPLFRKATLGNGTGQAFTIVADSTSPAAMYVREIRYNGTAQTKFLMHPQIGGGATLEFVMTATPTSPQFIPPVAETQPGVTVPFVVHGEQAFPDSTLLILKCEDPASEIRYTLNGNDPDESAMRYRNPIVIDRSCRLKMQAIQKSGAASFVAEAAFIKLPYRRTISYKFPYSEHYTAGGSNGLIDGVHGDPWVFGAWQGFEGTDMDVTIELDQDRAIGSVTPSFLQQPGSWIWLPESVTVLASDDSLHFRVIGSLSNSVDEHESGSFTKSFAVTCDGSPARYLRIIAKNRGVCPEWHPGAGGKAWVFADEIEIN